MEFDNIQLERLRVAKGFTQDGLCGAVDVSRYQIIKWEKGTATPTIAQINKLGEVLGVPASLFVRESKEVS
jgi:transcriptional regulator with XRE-family HTH domain